MFGFRGNFLTRSDNRKSKGRFLPKADIDVNILTVGFACKSKCLCRVNSSSVICSLYSNFGGSRGGKTALVCGCGFDRFDEKVNTSLPKCSPDTSFVLNNDRLTKHWKVVEVQLTQAAQFLLEPDRFSMVEKDLEEYHRYVDHNEFELAMDELSGIAQEFGCESGFWRRLKKAAIQMYLNEKAEQYEKLFHEALVHNK